MATSKNRKKQTKKTFELNNIHRVILILAGSLFALCIFTEGMGIVGEFISKSFFFLFGNAAFVIPVMLILIAVNSYLNRIETSDLSLIVSGIIIILIFASFFDSISNQPGVIKSRFNFNLSQSFLGTNGGLLGAFFNSVFLGLFGGIGLRIILVLSFFISFVVFFNLDYKNIWTNFTELLKNAFKSVKNKAESEKRDNKEKSNKNFPEKEKRTPIESSSKYFPKANEDVIIINDKSENSDKEDPYKIESKKTDETNEATKYEKAEIEDEIEKNSGEITYKFPSADLLEKSADSGSIDKNEIYENSKIIEETMSNFGIEAYVERVNTGPTVTCYELVPAPNVRLSKIVGLADNLSFSLASQDIRIQAPIPGKTAVGIEVPNKKKSVVRLGDIICSKEFSEYDGDLPLALGKDVEGNIVISSIDDMPHLLIAGATGSGKSVCINTIIISLLYNSSPEDVRMILVDPKIVELGNYNSIPHLLIPVVTDPKKAATTLSWAVEEMERRYKTFAENYVKDITSYNEKMAGTGEKMSKIVIIIDELADLMMVAAREVEDSIARLAQMARAAGMHLILATQRPSVDVITGTIKANIPSRISFSVSSQVDSRTILDSAGAEKLLGKGDMLFYPSFYSKPRRIQGAFVSQKEVDNVVNFFKENDFGVEDSKEIIEEIRTVKEQKKFDADPLMMEAIKLIVYDEQASISYFQRKLSIGYSRAARIMDQLEELGYVGPSQGSKPREIYITEDEYLELLGEDIE